MVIYIIHMVPMVGGSRAGLNLAKEVPSGLGQTQLRLTHNPG